MAEFIEFEAEAMDDSEDEEVAAESDELMIDDSDDLPNNDISFLGFSIRLIIQQRFYLE